MCVCVCACVRTDRKTRSSSSALVFLYEKPLARAHVSDGKWGLGPEEPEVGLDSGEL